MKKLFLIAFLGISGLVAYAQSYSFVSLSYDNTQLWYGDNWDTKDGLGDMGHESNSASLNGFGLQYTYGIGLGSRPMNLELGLKWNMGFDNAKWESEDYDVEEKYNTNFMRLSVPISYIYHFTVCDNFAIAPYAGLDFRFNLTGKTNVKWYEDGDLDEEWSYNWFKKDGEDGVGENYTFNRFQMGWHIGVRFEVKKLFLGLEYGTDFLPLWSHKWSDGDKAHINTGNLALSVGYKF